MIVTAQASLLAVVIVAAAAAVLGTASGESYTVGEPGGSWDLQTNLTAWASAIDFHPGDQLVFKYDASAHDVVEVSRDGYSSCSAASPVFAASRTGNDAVLLTGTTVCSDGPTTVIMTPGVASYGSATPGSSASLSSLLVTMVLLLLGFITA